MEPVNVDFFSVSLRKDKLVLIAQDLLSRRYDHSQCIHNSSLDLGLFQSILFELTNPNPQGVFYFQFRLSLSNFL